MTCLAASTKIFSARLAAALVAAGIALTGFAGAQAQAQTPVAHTAKHHKHHKRHKAGHSHTARHRRHKHRAANHAIPATGAAPQINTGTRTIIAPQVPSVCPNATLEPSSANLVLINQATLCLINQQRVAAGLVALAENPKLDSAAAHHSSDMIANNYFEHVSPSGETPEQRVLATGYIPSGAGYTLGENIASGSTGVDTPAQMVTAWMNSPEHKANILNPDFRETGMSAVAAMPASVGNGDAGATYTQEFGVISQ